MRNIVEVLCETGFIQCSLLLVHSSIGWKETKFSLHCGRRECSCSDEICHVLIEDSWKWWPHETRKLGWLIYTYITSQHRCSDEPIERDTVKETEGAKGRIRVPTKIHYKSKTGTPLLQKDNAYQSARDSCAPPPERAHQHHKHTPWPKSARSVQLISVQLIQFSLLRTQVKATVKRPSRPLCCWHVPWALKIVRNFLKRVFQWCLACTWLNIKQTITAKIGVVIPSLFVFPDPGIIRPSTYAELIWKSSLVCCKHFGWFIKIGPTLSAHTAKS